MWFGLSLYYVTDGSKPIRDRIHYFESKYWVHAHLVLHIFLRHHETRRGIELFTFEDCVKCKVQYLAP